jgi:tetratricopeptide (TPR) repeat protein
LSLLGTAPADDLTYQNQLRAAAILEPLFEHHPDHPGLAHYIIHAYDYPGLAERGLPAARVYGDIAPWVPHALHMPSHVFTRLGMWPDSIRSNLASAAAARAYTAEHHGGGTWYDELHAQDYLVFAYLQMAQDQKAAEIVVQVRGIQRFVFPNFAAAYAVGAIPARYALEHKDWRQAAALEVIHPEIVKPFPFAVAHTEFARAVGAARSGDLERARASITRLGELRDALQGTAMKWWIDQVEIQRLGASGWLSHAQGNAAEAERLLRAAAALEDKAGIHPVTPGPLLPAHEQVGELLFALGRPAEALAEYEATLAAFPGRFHAHLGGARAARAAGNQDVARQHYRALIDMAGAGTGHRKAIADAQAFLAGG